ncbi:ribonuclease HII [Candidatus Woesearchaeota archaeon]|nr:MAG: ribonuclease HII [Candidatus Woesearchaeota archaeon]
MLICGIDEAGRGPMIGPLVICGVLINEKDGPKLRKIGVTDSKLLTPKQREQLFNKIINTVKKYKIIIVEPREIDDALSSDDLNLNWLEALKTAQIINDLKPKKAILDAPSTNIKSYLEYIKKLLNVSVEIIAEHKADLNHPTVAAASILAKVTRDREIEKIQKKIGKRFGSGYPSDPETVRFAEKHHSDYPAIFRKTWASYKKIMEKKFQSTLDSFSP